MIKRILVPTDFSAASLRAVDYAIDFAKPHKAELLLVFVIEPLNYAVPRFYPQPTELLEEQRLLAAERMSRLRERIVKRYPNCRTDVHLGVVYQVIVEVAAAEKADLIIMSTQGHTGLQHFLLGSVAERVVRTAKCPVLTVPAHQRRRSAAGRKPAAARKRARSRR